MTEKEMTERDKGAMTRWATKMLDEIEWGSEQFAMIDSAQQTDKDRVRNSRKKQNQYNRWPTLRT